MVALIGYLVFASALVASLAVMGSTLVPALPRIAMLLRDGVDPVAVPARVTIVSEPRLRVRVAAMVHSPARSEYRAAA